MDEEQIIRDKIANASNPNSSEKTLRELSRDKDVYVKKAVLQNDKCPLDVIMDIYFSEKDELRKIAYELLLKEADNPELNENQLNKLIDIKDREICNTIVRHPKCTTEMLIRMLGSMSYDARFYMIDLPICTSEVLYKISAPEYKCIKKIIHSPYCTLDLLIKYYREYNELGRKCNDRREIVENELYRRVKEERLKEEDFIKVFNYLPFSTPINYIINNPSCPSNVIEKIYDYLKNRGILSDINFNLLFSNPNCPLHLFSELSLDSSYYKFVLTHPKCPRYIIDDILEHSEDENKLGEIAKNTQCTKEDLDKLFDKKNYTIMLGLLQNPIYPMKKVMEYLLEYNNIPYYIRMYYLDLERIRTTDNIEDLDFFANLKGKNCDDRILKALAENINCPEKYFDMLSKSSNDKVRCAAFSNPKFPLNAIVDCLNEGLLGSFEILIKIVNDPNTSINELNSIISRSRNAYINKSVINALVTIASDLNCTEEQFRDLSKVKIFKVIQAIVENPNCPEDIFQLLINNNSLLLLSKKVRDREKRKQNEKQYIDKFKEVSKSPDDLNKGKDSNRKTEELIRKELEKEERARIKKELEDIEKRKEEKRKEVEGWRKELKEHVKKSKELTDKIIGSEIDERFEVTRIERIVVPASELFVIVGDHKEINPEYINLIESIDFSLFVESDFVGLKVSGTKDHIIDWSKTNIRINPQTVYMKDLSYAKFGDHNIFLKSFDGCIMIGTDISSEKESYGIENSITDESTKLPKVVV